MTPMEEAELEAHLVRAIESEDDGAAAAAHLAAGRPIYYWDDEVQGNIRKWPDGRRELVKIDDAGQVVVVRVLR